MQPGDIVFAPFVLADGNVKVRPGLVLAVKQRLGMETELYLAYGTSQRTDNLQPWEIRIRPEDGEAAWARSGLAKPTVFCLEKRVLFRSYDIIRQVGVISAEHYAALERAVQAAVKRGWH